MTALTALLRPLLAGIVVTMSAVGLALAAPGPAFACSCVAAGPQEYLEWADSVVWAEVVDVQTPGPLVGTVHYLLEVERVYKGEVARSTQVDSDASSAACGLEGIESGRSYAFFLQGDGSPWSATLCTGTGTVGKDKLERIVSAGNPGAASSEGTGEGATPDTAPVAAVGAEPTRGGPDRLPVSSWSWAGVAVGGLGSVIACAVWLLRRRSAAS